MKIYNERLLKIPDKKLNLTDYINLSIIVLIGFSVIKITMKYLDILKKIE